jgi:hypothetical protein
MWTLQMLFRSPASNADISEAGVAPPAKSLSVCLLQLSKLVINVRRRVPPNAGPGLPYTIPIMTTVEGLHIMDSKNIV